MKYSPGGSSWAEGNSLRRRTGTKAAAALAAGGLILSSAGVAYADAIANRLDTSVDSIAESMTLNLGGLSATTKLYVVKLPDHDTNGCTINGKGEAVSLALTSSNAAVATVSPAIATFGSCEDEVIVTVTPQGVGTADVIALPGANSTGEPYDVSPVNFHVTVVAAAPSNTAPTLTISGVSAGTAYTKGSVPSAMCDVADKEDGSKSFLATVGPVTGLDAATGVGNQEVVCEYIDAGGLKAKSSLTYSIVDGSAPGVSYTLNPAAADGLNGWYRSAVTLDWNVTEGDSPKSLSTSGCDDVTVTTDQLPASYTCSASSGGGMAAPVSVSIKKDGTAPEVSYADATGTSGNDGWYTSDVLARFTATDATSGLSAPSATNSSIGEGLNVLVDSPVFTDNAGNASNEGAASQTFKIDWTAPEVAYDGAAPPNADGWYNTDVVATFRSTDSLSGPASDTKKATTSGEGDDVTVGSPAFSDVAGNTTLAGAATSDAFKVDKTAPTVSYDGGVTGTLGKNGWYKSNVDVTFNAVDLLSGLRTSSKVVTSSGENENVIVSSPAFTDIAGNTRGPGYVTPSFKIDTKAPTVSFGGATGTEGSNGWYTSDVEVTFDVADATSGVVEPTRKVTSEGEGADVKVASPAVEDRAGNGAAAGVVERPYSIDKTAPVVTFDSVLGDSYFGSTPAAPTCTATDKEGGSGIEGSCTVEGFKTTVGKHTLYATAKDFAGHETTVLQTYEVKAWTPSKFYQPIDMSGVWNTVKGGSTVPAKFEVFAGTTELTDPSRMKFSATQIACTLGTSDAIELTATGSTSLRYDAVAGQFIYNWKTPTAAGSCYRLTMSADDGSSISANFKLK